MKAFQKYHVGDILEFKTEQGVQQGRVRMVAVASWLDVRIYVEVRPGQPETMIEEKQVIDVVRRAWQPELPRLRSNEKSLSGHLH